MTRYVFVVTTMEVLENMLVIVLNLPRTISNSGWSDI